MYLPTEATTGINVTVSDYICQNQSPCYEVEVPISYMVNNQVYESQFEKTFTDISSSENYVNFYQNSTHQLKIFYLRTDPTVWGFHANDGIYAILLTFALVVVFLPCLFCLYLTDIIEKLLKPDSSDETSKIIEKDYCEID